MKEAMCISNSKRSAQKPQGSMGINKKEGHDRYSKGECTQKEEKKAEKKAATAMTSSKSPHQRKLYRDWVVLCMLLCIGFPILIGSGDTFRSLSESDGISAMSKYLTNKIKQNEELSVFFGFEEYSEDCIVDTQGAQDTTPDAEILQDVPVFVFGEGLSANEYIEKYNKYAYLHSGAIPVFGVISSDYSFRKNPFYGIYEGEEQYQFHRGVDIAADEGSNILCYLDGTVKKTALSASYGKYVIVDHGYGMQTLYAHASEITVSEGDEVKEGDVIAKVGHTGRATGPHLHFEVIVNSETQNPKYYLSELYFGV